MQKSQTFEAVQAASADNFAVLKLQKPVYQGTEMITELKLRYPGVDDICSVGLLFTLSGDEFRIDPVKVKRYASLLAGLPPSVISSLSIPDFMRLVNLIGSFFNNGDSASLMA